MVKRNEDGRDNQPIITFDHVLACILSFIQEDRIPANPRRFHSAIYSLKREFQDRHTELLLKDLVFSNTGRFRRCTELDEVLFRLQNCRIILILGPDYASYIIPSSSKHNVQERILPRLKNYEPILREMALKLETLFFLN